MEIKEYKHQWYLKNRERILEQKKQYQQDNKEKIAEYDKKYYQANKEKIAEQKKQNYQVNKEKVLEQVKQYRQANKEKIAEQKKQYRQTPMGRASHLVDAYKRKDKKHNRGECTLTAKWIVENIFTKPCIYCGETDWRKLGCDRIDNSKPHTLDNVVPCCTKCNKKRGKKPFEVFLKEMQEKMLEEFETP